MQAVRHSRIQHGVGQGSFHSATVEAVVNGDPYRFDYVYDCGGLVGPRPSPAMKRALMRLDVTGRANPAGLPTAAARGVIDALILSHFDQDHLNGAETLAGRFTVERIYLPYLSPRELALVIARQAHDLSEASVAALHQIATGGDTLFGVPVTRVGGPPLPDFNRGNPEDGRPAPESNEGANNLPRGFPDPRQRAPLPMTVAVEPAGTPVAGTLPHEADLAVNANGSRLWQLRFWNHGVDDTLVWYVIDLLGLLGFPLDALERTDGAQDVLAWLKVPGNRQEAEGAYFEAIRLLNPSWVDEVSDGRLPNFISLALFSGPWHWDWSSRHRHYYNIVSGAALRRWSGLVMPWDTARVGWLGTGDALLGEPTVWNDFKSHYHSELPRVRTVLVPHHGAAPLGGPAFYNDELNAKSETMSVISVGTRNPYGHPRPEVLKRVAIADGVLQIVTEDWYVGFHEVIWAGANVPAHPWRCD